jgi:glutathione S-transferase
MRKTSSGLQRKLGEDSGMIVYGSSVSPYVRKVLAFAAEKGIELENQFAGPGSQDPEFREASPFCKIPAFRDGDFTVSDSSAIIAYLEAMQPDPCLIPQEPKARARTIWYDEFADTILFGAGRNIFFNRMVAPKFLKIEGDLAVAERAEKEELPPIVDYLETVIPPSGFLVEDRLTLADLAVASPWVNMAHVGILIDPAKHPKSAAYIETIHARPSFAELIAKEKAFLTRFLAPEPS